MFSLEYNFFLLLLIFFSQWKDSPLLEFSKVKNQYNCFFPGGGTLKYSFSCLCNVTNMSMYVVGFGWKAAEHFFKFTLRFIGDNYLAMIISTIWSRFQFVEIKILKATFLFS